MRPKPDLVPDCDIHGEPMRRDHCPAQRLGLKEARDLIVWHCVREGCDRHFYGTVGYCQPAPSSGPRTPRCQREGAFLIVQRARGLYICPVAGCTVVETWDDPESPFVLQTADARERKVFKT